MANQKQAARAAAAAQQKAEQAKNDKRNMIIGIIAVLLVAAVGLWAVLGGRNEPVNQPSQVVAKGPTAASTITEKVTHEAVIEVKDYGTIKAVLYGEAAPITVSNFVKLAGEGFYDGLTFHRIIDGFMIQGGDPKGNGTGGSDENIKGEFAQNGFDNPIQHLRGVLSMARSSAPDSASSQFFIMHDVSPWLDGAYAAFGCVTEGIEIVDAICQKTPVTDGNGTVKKADQPVITSIRVTEAVQE